MISKTTTHLLGDVASFKSGGTPNKSKADYWGGQFPWISAKDLKSPVLTDSIDHLTKSGFEAANIAPENSLLILVRGMTLFKDVPVCLAGRDVAFNQDIKALVVSEELIPQYLMFYLHSQKNRLLELVDSAGHGTGRLDTDLLKAFPVVVPPLPEQTAITSLLATWNLAIEKTERLIAVKEQYLRVLRERYLQKTQQSKWVKLQAVTRESIARNGARLGRDSIMAVTKQVGMRPMKVDTIAAIIERYKVVQPRAFAYNPMRLNIGSIVMSPFDDDVLVSPDYVVFECNESRLLPGYLNHLRRSRHWSNYFESAGSGSVRVRIYYDDLSTFAFDLPPVDVQRRIVDFLDAVMLEIDLLKKQAEAYRRQKRGLMQKLLTGVWRVRVG